MNQQLIVFAVACAMRLIFAYIYFGSCDVDAFINITQHTLNNNLTGLPYWNYFPAITIYLYIAGFLAAKTSLPIAFCMKIIPVIFDSLLAVLIYDVAKAFQPTSRYDSSRGSESLEESVSNSALADSPSESRLSAIASAAGSDLYRGAGLLYALCPIPILVASIHGQYDCLFLFFLILSFYVRDSFMPSFSTHFIFGTLFAFSLLLKPVVLVLTPLFFVPRKGFLSALGILWKWWLAFGIGFVLYVLLVFALLKKQAVSLTVLLEHYRLFVVGAGLLFSIAFLLVLLYTGHHLWQQCKLDSRLYTYLHYQLFSIFGFMSTMLVGFFMFQMLGFNLLQLIDTILRYCNQGVQIFGLPFAWPFTIFQLSLLIKNRIWLMLLLLILAVFYYKQKLSTFQALGLSIALILGLSGLCPQYLMWLVPFIIINRWTDFGLMYGLLGSLFLIFFYSNPFANPDVAYQNGLSFAPLESFSFFSPPPWVSAGWVVLVLRVIGNYIIPGLCIGFIFTGLCRASGKQVASLAAGRNILFYKNKYVLSNVAIFLIAIVLVLYYKTSLGPLFSQSKLSKLHYLSHMINNRWTAFFIGHWFFNIVTVLILMTAVWGVYAWKCIRRSRS